MWSWAHIKMTNTFQSAACAMLPLAFRGRHFVIRQDTIYSLTTHCSNSLSMRTLMLMSLAQGAKSATLKHDTDTTFKNDFFLSTHTSVEWASLSEGVCVRICVCVRVREFVCEWARETGERTKTIWLQEPHVIWKPRQWSILQQFLPALSNSIIDLASLYHSISF